LLESDELEAQEEEVFAAVMAWLREDEAGRKAELERLLPLVRFPMMAAAPGLLMMSEPLVAKHPLAFELLAEAHPGFGRSTKAANCPRLRPRKGQRLGGLQAVLPALTFTRASPDYYDITEEGGATAQSLGGAEEQAAVCGGYAMDRGMHAAEFTVVKVGELGVELAVGLARRGIDVDEDAFLSSEFWGLDALRHGTLSYGEGGMVKEKDWEGMEGFGAGDVMGLLLDCDAGTLTVKKNGRRLGVAHTGLEAEGHGFGLRLCWAVACTGAGSQLRIAAVDPAAF
jgi:hypothetical protein